MRPRKTGRSTITAVKSLYYIFHVLLGVFVNVLKFEGRRRKDTRQNRNSMERLLNVTTVLSIAADGHGAVLGPPLAHPRRVFGKLAGRGRHSAGAFALVVRCSTGSPASLGSPTLRWPCCCWSSAYS